MTPEQQEILYGNYIYYMGCAQAGIAQEVGQGTPDELKAAGANPKHLRVGINAAMVEHSALTKLLIDKGIITEEEYLCALVQAAKAEKEMFEKRLTGKLGTNIKLHCLQGIPPAN